MRNERGQVAVLGVLLISVFLLIAAGLVDVYALYEARNWGYQAAQQAAWAGASAGRDWNSVLASGCEISLLAPTAASVAHNVLVNEMASRGITTYTYDIRVLPNPTGGSVAHWPPVPVRLGAGRGAWTVNEPSVGVYLSFPVSTFLLSLVGRPTVDVHVFAAASVAQPTCP